MSSVLVSGANLVAKTIPTRVFLTVFIRLDGAFPCTILGFRFFRLTVVKPSGCKICGASLSSFSEGVGRFNFVELSVGLVEATLFVLVVVHCFQPLQLRKDFFDCDFSDQSF